MLKVYFISFNLILLSIVNRPLQLKMSGLKLTYFDVTALGEPIRFLLAYGGLEFEDEHVTEETWPARKYSFPYGKVPVLRLEDGRILHQSASIARYLARRVGLAGENENEQLDADIAVDTLNDLRSAIAGFCYENHEEAKAQKRTDVLTNQVPYYLGKFEAHVTANGGHFVGGKLTWADFWFAGIYNYLNHMCESDIFADYPKLKALKEKVFALPQIKKFLEGRVPVSY